MKAYSLWQPYAIFMPLGIKQVETRDYRTKHRGETAIASAKTEPAWVAEHVLTDPIIQALLAAMFTPDMLRPRRGTILTNFQKASAVFERLPRGQVLGTVDIIGVASTAQLRFNCTAQEIAVGDYSDGKNGRGRFGWLTENAIHFDTYYPATGAHQGQWEWVRP